MRSSLTQYIRTRLAYSWRIASVALYPHYHLLNYFRNRCSVCDRNTLFLCTTPKERWTRQCLWCHSTPKYRALAFVLKQHLGKNLGQLLQHGGSVYEFTTASPFFRVLHGHPKYFASGYFYDKPFGKELRPGVWNQDAHNLSFSDASFDVVISSETMEHVRTPWQGFREIHRVLKPGGVHVFTIPYRDDRITTSRVDTSGEVDKYILPKIYHQDPYRKEDSLVYTDFGRDLPNLLDPIGFKTSLLTVLSSEQDIQNDLAPMPVFISKKET
jgi:hypothetical protein